MQDDDSFFDEPPPPGPEEQQHGYDVAHLRGLLDQAARGAELVWVLSTALCALQGCAMHKGRVPLSEQERSTLLAALERAYRTAWVSLDHGYPRHLIVSGMQGAAQLIEFWARPPSTPGYDDPIRDAVDTTRCFRNDLHNMSLRIEMRDRAARREAAALFGAEHSVQPPPIAFVSA